MIQLDQAISALQDIAKALHDADNTNIALVVVTAGLAIATIILGLRNLKITKSQIQVSEERQDKEHFERVRPWINIDGPKPAQVIFADGDSLLWDKFRSRDPSDKRQPVQMKFVMRYTNTGIRPAKNLGKLTYSDTNPFSREEFEKKQEQLMNTDLGPNQEQFITFILTWNSWLALENEPLIIGLRISYDNGKNRSHSGVIYKITITQTEIIAVWYD